ncbi:MAG TPA: polysaccharide biosynthesis/export family protein [Gemmatimonadaceae bacterium]|nr:polysaccharide biosynthesis/export family protein [Gemmatimonadaceae bacterium]
MLCALLIWAWSPATAAAQTTDSVAAATGDYATRAELEAEAAAHPDRAAAIQRRLSEGDLQVGDRLLLQVRGIQGLSDTVVVRAGRMLEIPGLPPIPVAGVLRSELKDHLTKQLSQYVRDPQVVEVTPLVRVQISGSVGRPGFYALPADVLLSDALMYAGGPDKDADMGRSFVQRGTERIVAPEAFRTAVAAGSTLDKLDLRAGDVIQIEQRRGTNWNTIARVAGLGLALTGTIVALTR